MKTQKNEKWLLGKEQYDQPYYILNQSYAKYTFYAYFFPNLKRLNIEESGKSYDDHAFIKFKANSLDEASKIVDSIISVKTI